MKHNYYLPKAIGIGLLSVFTLLNGCKSELTPEPVEAKKTSVSNVVNFVHPGVVNTQRGLDFVRLRYATGGIRKTWFDNSVAKYINEKDASGNRIRKPSTFVTNNVDFTPVVIGSARSADELKMKVDGMLAYANALAWVATGSSQYSTEAKLILNAYGYHCQGLTVDPADGNERTKALEASWMAPTFVAAAEIIRDYKRPNSSGVLVTAGWSVTDQNQFGPFINTLKEYINTWIVENADTASSDPTIKRQALQRVNSNIGVTAGFAKMAIGVYFNNENIYTSGYKWVKRRLTKANTDIVLSGSQISADDYLIKPYNAYETGKYVGFVWDNGNTNDCDHFQYTLTALTYAAEIARNIDPNDTFIYEYSNRLLLDAYEYQYEIKYPAGNPTHTKAPYDRRTCDPTENVWPGAEVANRYYNPNPSNILNQSIEKLRSRNAPNTVVPVDDPDFTFFGFTTFTHYQVPMEW